MNMSRGNVVSLSLTNQAAANGRVGRNGRGISYWVGWRASAGVRLIAPSATDINAVHHLRAKKGENATEEEEDEEEEKEEYGEEKRTNGKNKGRESS